MTSPESKASSPRSASYSDEAEAGTVGEAFELALFPLGHVLFPDAALPLKIFEARYLDLISRCLRSNTGFGVVALREGAEAGLRAGPTLFERVGTVAKLDQVDSTQPGILLIQTRGTQRFRMSTFRQAADGLWTCQARWLPSDPVVAPLAAHEPVVDGLRRAIEVLREQGAEPFETPHRFEDAGWVANRWCELLPESLAVKQRLMSEMEPLTRLSRVFDLLRQNAQR